MTTGIYKFENTVNKKIYIGSSRNIERRVYDHFHELRNNKHSNLKLQSAFNKYKETAFQFSVIEECAITDLKVREQFWIDSLNVVQIGYNICLVADRPPDMRGRKLSAAHIEKIRARKIGKKRKPFSKEWCRKLSEAAKKPRPNQSIKIKASWQNRMRPRLEVPCSNCGKTKILTDTAMQSQIADISKYKCVACYRLPRAEPEFVNVKCPSCKNTRKLRYDSVRKDRIKICYNGALKTRRSPGSPSKEALAKRLALYATPEYKARKSEATRRSWIERRKKQGSEQATSRC